MRFASNGSSNSHQGLTEALWAWALTSILGRAFRRWSLIANGGQGYQASSISGRQWNREADGLSVSMSRPPGGAGLGTTDPIRGSAGRAHPLPVPPPIQAAVTEGGCTCVRA
jgi:hypothetical protein